MSKFLKWFSGGDKPYVTMLVSMHGHKLATYTLAGASFLIFIAYLFIAGKWWRDEKSLPAGPAKNALQKMKWMFLLDAMVGYGFVALRLFWPAYRLKDILLIPLVYLSWSFLFRGGLRDVYAAMTTVKTEHDDLNKMRETLDNLPSLAWTAQPDGSLDWYNRGWYEYTGTTFNEMKGWGWQKCHHPDELPRVIEKWKACIATGSAFEHTFPLRRHDGCFRWFLTRCTPVKNAAGEVVCWCGGNTDVDHLYRGKQNAEKLTIDDFIRKMNAFAGKA